MSVDAFSAGDGLVVDVRPAHDDAIAILDLRTEPGRDGGGDLTERAGSDTGVRLDTGALLDAGVRPDAGAVDLPSSGADSGVDRPVDVASDAGTVDSLLVDAGADARGNGDAVACGFTVPNPAATGLPNSAAYDTSLTGIALDKVTGLMWERFVNGHSESLGCSVDQRGGLLCPLRYAAAYCAANRLGGFADWRLPSQAELASLVDFTVEYPAIDQDVFADTPWEPFWSSTRVAGGQLDYAWFISFKAGTPANAFIDEPHRVRCVRTATVDPARCYSPGARFQVADAFVTDKATGLVWQKDGAPKDNNFAGAQAYCASLGSGFRLPSVKELLSLLDLTKTVSNGPLIDKTAFPHTSGWYWTSSTDVGAYQAAWSMDFDEGWLGYAGFSNNIGATKCVR